MTPLEYEDVYHNLTITLEDLKTTTVNVRRYQNNDKIFKEDANLGNKAALVKKDILIGRMGDEATRIEKKEAALAKGKPAPAGDIPSDGDSILTSEGALSHLKIPAYLRAMRPTMMTVHSGKGSPKEIQICLHLVAIYKLYDTKAFTDSAAGVRDYCDKYIGLDCNGYVGNYARDNGAGKEPNTPIGEYVNDVKKRRAKLEDVQPLDVLAWTDRSHITLIHSIDPPVPGPDGKMIRKCMVVESTASNPSGGAATANGGLQHSTYTILSVDNNRTFTLDRPNVPAVKRFPTVHIAAIK